MRIMRAMRIMRTGRTMRIYLRANLRKIIYFNSKFAFFVYLVCYNKY